MAAATSTTLATGVKTGTEEACSTPSVKRVKKLSPPQPGDNIRRTTTKTKVKLAKHLKAVKSESRLAKMWAEQVSIKAMPIE